MLGKKTFVYISLFGKEHYKDVLGEIVFKLGSFKVILRLTSSVLDSTIRSAKRGFGILYR